MTQQSPEVEKQALPTALRQHTRHDRHTCGETMLQVPIEHGQIHAIAHSVATPLSLDNKRIPITISLSGRAGMDRHMQVLEGRNSIHRNSAQLVIIFRMEPGRI
jgi:hypothetical protein